MDDSGSMIDSVSLIDEWYVKAQEDIDTARHMQTFWRTPISVVCYHCQQAGEKILKGILAQTGGEVPRTHQLGTVLSALNDSRLEHIRKACDQLTDYAVTSRYPTAFEHTDADLKIAIDALDLIMDAVAGIGYPIE
ncbi:hypothetical protein FACS1894184_13780 [Clostridia bacterium]|nr:hypothetical protein FACS1894184_13780 [Clostridia bacterium]